MASTACIDTTQKGLPCPVPPLAGRDVCHFHAKVRDREAQRKEEDAERAVRGVKLCGGFNRKCPDGAEIPLTQKLNTCDACTKTVRERALANKAKRDAATAERNKANASAGVRECSNCHEKFPPSEFETERKKSDSYRLGAGEKVSDRCRGCRERVRELKAAGTIPERSKTNREEEKAARKAIAEKAAAEGKRICSRHGSVTDGCWVVLPDAYEPPTCEPCIKLREDYNASKRKKKEEKKAKSTEEETQPKEEAEEMKEGEIKNPAMDTGSTAGALVTPERPGMCAGLVRMTGAPCKNKVYDGAKYCKKHVLDGVREEILERGGRVCTLIFQNAGRGCLRELPEGTQHKTCDQCRALAKAGFDQSTEKKREEATKEVARLEAEGIVKKMCMNPKCCGVKDPSEFVFEGNGDRDGWCTECREKRQEREKKLPGGKRKRTEADRETARAYEQTPARKAAKLAFKEANPERVAQYSRDSRERHRAADPEGFLRKGAAQQMHQRNRSRKIFTEDGDDDVNLIDSATLIEKMDSVCFFCGEEDTVERPLGIARMDLNLTWSEDNCVPICAICSPIRRRVDARTFIARCVYLQEIADGGASAWFPAELFGEFPYGGQFGVYTASAKTKGISFELTKDQFEAAVDQPCYICNRRSKEGHKNGLDRVDNNVGYTVGNVRAACGDCNYMKGELSVDVFKAKVAKIARRSALTLSYVPITVARSTFHMTSGEGQIVG